METVKEEPLNYYLDPANIFPIDEMNDPGFREWMAKNWAPPANALSAAQKKRIKRAKFFKTAIINLAIT